MEKVGKVSSARRKATRSSSEYRDTARQLMNVEGAVEELNREAVRHEHRGLVARQGARDLLEEGKKKEARTLIEQMLSERNYVVACGVTSRRIKRLSDEIKEAAKRSGGITKRVAKGIADVEISIKGSVLAEIEESLNALESAINPNLEKSSSVIELVSTVKTTDIDQLQRELEGEIAFLANLSRGKTNDARRLNTTRRYKLEKKLDRGDTSPEIKKVKADTESEEDTKDAEEEEEEEGDEEGEDEEDAEEESEESDDKETGSGSHSETD